MLNRTTLLCSAAVIAVVLPLGAQAQSQIDNFSWTGGYIGADVGVGIGATLRTNDNGGGPLQDGSFGSEAVTGGVFAGYNYEVAPGMVFGVEAGLDFFNSEASGTQSTFVDQYEFRSLGSAYAGVVAGAEIAPRTLMYGRLAYAAIHAQTSEELFDAKEEFLNGYHVAVGLQSEVVDNVMLRVEGTYTAAVEDLVSGDLGEYSHTPSHFGASVGVSYRFGGESRGPRVDLEPTRSWSGGYVGVLAGGLSSSSLNGGRQTDFAEGPVSDIEVEYGGFVGANLQVGDQWVVGVEGELLKSSVVYDATFVDDAYDYASSDIRGQASVRLGYLVNPDTLIYARAGYGLMHINPDEFNSYPGTEAAYIQTVSAGVGVESMISENALLRVEGLYSTAIEEYRFTDNFGDPAIATPYYVKPTSVEARVGAAFLF
jgi:outer membrane immunogenic protein